LAKKQRKYGNAITCPACHQKVSLPSDQERDDTIPSTHTTIVESEGKKVEVPCDGRMMFCEEAIKEFEEQNGEEMTRKAAS
jgi:hypothetical protein